MGARLLRAAIVLLLLAGTAAPALAREVLGIGGTDGSIEFAIGDSRIFRTTGGFRTWEGRIEVDDANVAASSVQVTVQTGSLTMLDRQQTQMLKDDSYFAVERFPEMSFRSDSVQQTSPTTLKVDGLMTMRGITRPMTFDVTVADRRPDAPIGGRYARFRASGTLKRSEFGMTKFVDVIGDTVEIVIRADARRLQ